MKYNLIIENTSYCNQKCKFCPQHKYSKKDRIMPFDMFKKIIDAIYKLKIPISHITLSGMGEPFTDKDIFKKTEYANKLAPVETYTNGKLFNEVILKNIAKHFYRVYLSIHGNTPKEYEDYTSNNFSMIKSKAQIAKKILRDKLIISNHPLGMLEPYLELNINHSASTRPMFNWGQDDIAMEINSNIMHQKYCELLNGIVFRVDGSLATCCSDWNNSNNILNLDFSYCEICCNKNIYTKFKESGKLKDKIQMLRNIKNEVNNDGSS